MTETERILFEEIQKEIADQKERILQRVEQRLKKQQEEAQKNATGIEEKLS